MDVTVVCPFFNEERIVEWAIRQLLERLEALDAEWELIVVNDGSRDRSWEIASSIQHPRLRVIGYEHNRGRGYALRTGIAQAKGDVIVTTEIDLSWGEEIVRELVEAMRRWPDADIVVASPHLPGGGYRNVPAKRVLFSRFGNRVIRACVGDSATMNTGMTRAYRRSAIQSLPLHEDRKEFHLEVILKATAFGMRIREIPAVLEWREYKHEGQRVQRTSSSKVGPLVLSHSLFSLSANPVRYIWAMSLACAVLALVSLGSAVVLFAMNRVSVFMALISISLLLLGLVLFIFGVVVKQGYMVQREMWLLQRAQLELDSRRRLGSGPPGGPRPRAASPVPVVMRSEPAD